MAPGSRTAGILFASLRQWTGIEISQQPVDRPETLQRQPRLGEVEGERPLKDRGEARGQNAGDFFVRVNVQDQLKDLGALLGDRSDQAGDEQCAHVVGTSPGD